MIKSVFKRNLSYPHTENVYYATYLLTEIYKKREDPNYKSPIDFYLDVLPTNQNNFPSFLTGKEL